MEENQSKYGQLLDDAKSYLSTRYDLFRLELLDKLSVILGMLVLLLVLLFFCFGALAYLSVALVSWMANVMPVSVSCLILAGLFIVTALTLYLMRERLFINHFVGWLSKVLFSEQKPSRENESLTQQDNGTK